jgi:hypothetical protein
MLAFPPPSLPFRFLVADSLTERGIDRTLRDVGSPSSTLNHVICGSSFRSQAFRLELICATRLVDNRAGVEHTSAKFRGRLGFPL